MDFLATLGKIGPYLDGLQKFGISGILVLVAMGVAAIIPRRRPKSEAELDDLEHARTKSIFEENANLRDELRGIHEDRMRGWNLARRWHQIAADLNIRLRETIAGIAPDARPPAPSPLPGFEEPEGLGPAEQPH